MSRNVTYEDRCDKCGKLVEFGLGRASLKKHDMLFVMFPNWSQLKEYDLCRDCYHKLQEWFDEKVIEND